MTRLLLGIFFCLYWLGNLSPAQAGQPVRSDNEKRCVEYFIQNGVLSCNDSITQTPPDLEPALKALPIAPVFDGRSWRLNWWNQKPERPMLEYGLPHEPVGHWSELVTTEFFPGLQAKLSPQQLMSIMISELRKRGFQPQIHVLSSKPGDVIYEFIITNTPAENQHEIQRIWSSANGLYVIHYASRPTMSKERRQQWIDLLSKAKPLRG
jgi:hypothetical protein